MAVPHSQTVVCKEMNSSEIYIPRPITQLLQCYQQMHTLRYNHSNVLTRQLLHVSALTGPSSGSAQ